MKNRFIITLLCSLFGVSTFAQRNCAKCDILLDEKTRIEDVCRFVERMPYFQQGEGAFLSYIISKIEYPNNSRLEDSTLANQDKFLIQFIVSREGKIVYARVKDKEKENYTFMEKQLLEIVTASPDWIPGKCGGGIVPVCVTMPIRIQLKDN